MTVETVEGDHMSEVKQRARRQRNRAPLVLAAALVLLVAYYVAISASGALSGSSNVPIAGAEDRANGDFATVQMKVQDIDLTNRVIEATVLPIPHGALVGERAGEMSESLRIEIASAGVTTSVVAYPGESIVDPTAISLALDRGDTSYPLDQPYADFQVSVTNDQTGDAIPFEIDLENTARPWTLSASVGDPTGYRLGEHYPVTISGSRDVLTIALVVFYILAILLTTLIAVVTIGDALIRQELEFSNVIWLSATMLSFPALRSAMPGAPPIGTAMDFIVLFPCIALIAVMLVWTGAYMLWKESSGLRRRRFDEAPGT